MCTPRRRGQPFVNPPQAWKAGPPTGRIFEATDCYPPPLVGGRDLRVQLLSRELARRGHQMDVLTLAGPREPRIERDDDVRVHRLAGWSRILSPFYADPDKPIHPTLPDPGLVRAIAKLLNEYRPDVVRYCQNLWMGVFQATSVSCDSSGSAGVMSMGRSRSFPLRKTAPLRTRATRCGALTARQRVCAASISL